jgi:disulfide bond formation protein DsbB
VGLLEWYRVFTWLCLAAIGTSVVLVVARTGVLGSVGDSVRDALVGQGLAMAALVASAATVGSLYLSEGAGLTPCRLCWFQRCAMYPLAVILIIAAIRRDATIAPYALTIAGLGSLISLWHIAVEWRPSLEGIGGSCALEAPCSARLVPLAFGFVSIPVMALSAFVLSSLFVLAHSQRPTRPRLGSSRRPLGESS